MADTASVGGATAALIRNAPADALAADSRFVQKLFRKVKRGLTTRTSYGMIEISSDFRRIDRNLGPSMVMLDPGAFCSLFSGMIEGVCIKELEVLFSLLDEGGAGSLDAAAALAAMRKLFHCTAQQFHDALKKARAKRPQLADSPFRTKRGRIPQAPLSKDGLFAYLAGPLGLTQSEAYLFVDYCSVQDRDVREPSAGSTGSAALGEVDAAYCEAVLFSDHLPDDVAYPLLMAKLVESATDPAKAELTGTTGMLRVLRQVPLLAPQAPPPSDPRGHPSDSRFSQGDSPEVRLHNSRMLAMHDDDHSDDDDHSNGEGDSRANPEDAILSRCLDQTGFRKFLHMFQGGLPAPECDLLFTYVCDADAELLPVGTFLNLFQERIDVWAAVDMNLTVGTIRQHVSLLALHAALAGPFGCYTEVPLGNVVLALRRCGVPATMVADIEVEHVYRETRTPAAVVLLIRGPVPQGREQLISKLFRKLDDDDDGVIPKELAVRAFDPYHLTDAAEGAFVQEELAAFVHTLPLEDNTMSYSDFLYFWSCVATRYSDDAFTMLLWRGYQMQNARLRGEASVARERRGVPLQQLMLLKGANVPAGRFGSPSIAAQQQRGVSTASHFARHAPQPGTSRSSSFGVRAPSAGFYRFDSVASQRSLHR